MNNKLRFKLEILAGSTIALGCFLLGTRAYSPNETQKYLLSALGGAVTASTVIGVYCTLNDKSGALGLDIKRLESQVKTLKVKLDKEYEDAANIIAVNDQMTKDISDKDFVISSQGHDLKTQVDNLLRLASEASRLEVLNTSLESELTRVTEALNAELQENQDVFDREVNKAAHDSAKAKSSEVHQRIVNNYQTKLTAQNTALKESYEISLSHHIARIDELNRELETVSVELDETRTAKDELLAHCKQMNDQAFPAIKDAYETDWKANDDLVQTAINQLQTENARLNEPRLFRGLTSIDGIGNQIISHFWQHQIILDAVESIASTKGFKLRFSLSRNSDYTKLTEEEFDKRVCEPGLMGLSHDKLNFDLDCRNFVLSVQITTSIPKESKKSNSEDVKELSEVAVKFPYIKSATEFNKVAKILLFDNKVPSLRINGGSGTGKSSVCRLLLEEGLKEKAFKIRLHDPQDGSSEDRWAVSKVSKTVKEAALSILELRDSVENKTDPISPVLDVFDEIDGMCRSDSEVKAAYLTISTQVRHLENQSLIVIGQSPSVSRNGLQWADMDSVGCVYLADSAIQAIEHSPKLKGRNKKLVEQYNELLDESAKSEENDSNNFFRFALVVLPGKPPFWLELPKFKNGIEGYSNTTKTANIAPNIAQNTVLSCPHCAHTKHTKNGSNRLLCKGCGKTFSATLSQQITNI